jgi:hypothetical protein
MGVPFLPWKLEFKQFRFHHIERVLRCYRLQRFRLSNALLACFCSLCLSTPGKPLTQEYFSKFLPSVTGIPHRAQRRTQAGQRTVEGYSPQSFRLCP